MAQIARDLGISESGLRRWMAQADVDHGTREGRSSSEKQELVRLRRQNRVLQMENEILKRAAAYSLRRTSSQNNLHLHRSDLAVVACCRALKVSVSDFYEWPAPSMQSCTANYRQQGGDRDDHRDLRPALGHLCQSSHLGRSSALGQDIPIARKRVERLMRKSGIEGGYRRRRRHGTTERDPRAVRPDELVNQQFGRGEARSTTTASAAATGNRQ